MMHKLLELLGILEPSHGRGHRFNPCAAHHQNPSKTNTYGENKKIAERRPAQPKAPKCGTNWWKTRGVRWSRAWFVLRKIRRLFSPIPIITGARHWGSPGVHNPRRAGRPPRVRVRISLGGQEMTE